MSNQVKAGDLIELGSRIEGMLQKSKLLEQQLAAANARVEALEAEICVADARLTRAESTIATCKAAGFVTESGQVRKVLGTLPITADGCVIGDDCKVWFQGQYVNVEPMRSSVSGESDWHAFRCDKVYSSAEAAKGGREG